VIASALILYVLIALISLERFRENERQSIITNNDRLSDAVLRPVFLQ
jgi:hypothetical protein